jgi:hypothetical protein
MSNLPSRLGIGKSVLHDNGLRAGSLIAQSMANLTEKQVQKLMVEARKIGLDLERKELEQDLNHKAVATQIESHLYTVHTVARGEIRRTTPYIENESGHMTIKSSSCFVATTAYGDRNHPDVVLLRKFRDEVLTRSSAGRSWTLLLTRP